MKRRDFIKTTGLGAVAFAALPDIGVSWADVPSRMGTFVAGRKLNVACIGIGGKGRGDVAALASEHIVALCDVDVARGRASFDRFPNATPYRDFRRIHNWSECSSPDSLLLRALPEASASPRRIARAPRRRYTAIREPRSL